MWKATFTALWSRKLRLAMSTLAIVLGVAFVSGSFIFSDMIKGSFDQIAKGSISDVEVTKAQDVAVADGKANEARLTPDIVTKVSEVSGVSKAHGVVSGQGVMMINTKGKAMASFGPPQLGFNWLTAPAMGGLKGITLESGHAPQADDQIVVDPGSLKKSGWKIGDTVKVITPEQGTQQFTIVGTGTFGEGGTAGASYTFFTTKKAQELFVGGANAFTSIWTVTDKDANRAQVAEQVQKLLPERYQARDGQVVDDDSLFQNRPSAAGDGYDPLNSYGSNLGPESPELVAAIREQDSEEAERVLFGHIRRTRLQLARHPEVFAGD